MARGRERREERKGSKGRKGRGKVVGGRLRPQGLGIDILVIVIQQD
jgi:hypothetical protein